MHSHAAASSMGMLPLSLSEVQGIQMRREYRVASVANPIEAAVQALLAGHVVKNDWLERLSNEWVIREHNYYGKGVGIQTLKWQLSDRKLGESEFSKFTISDATRIAYAREELKTAFDICHPFSSPSFHGCYLTSDDGHCVLLISSEGHEFEPYGLFLDFAAFEAKVRSEGYLLTGPNRNFNEEQVAVSDSMILEAWHWEDSL